MGVERQLGRGRDGPGLLQQMIYQDAVVYDWPNINAKTLEIGGEKDGATPDFPARAKKACATVPNCQLLLFPNVGPVPHLRSPRCSTARLLASLVR